MMEYKNYLIKSHNSSPNLYYIATKGQGGKIPDILASLFTSTGIAKYEIDNYLIKKEVKNGKAGSQSGD